MSDHLRPENPSGIDALLDDALEQMARVEPSADQADDAAARVWQRLTAADAGTAAEAAEIQSIDGCDDYQALIPAYLGDSLPQARRILVEDHTRECVPCRRALKAAREGRPMQPAAQAVDLTPTPRTYSFTRWAIAAALVAGIGVSQFLIREMLPFGANQSATVHSADGELFRVATAAHMPLTVDDTLLEGQSVRTSRDGGAVLRLEDGSLVELSARSQVSIDESRRGTTIQLERGNVIVQAAKQRDRHLYVATDDCLVSVTGTIFSVNHGTKGSRVSVIEGEVKVNFSDHEEVLTPGDQVATQAHLNFIPLDEEIAWSRDLDTYLQMLEDADALKREIRETVPFPELRYSSRILDLVPEDTVFYSALPNLGTTVSETHRVVQEHLAKNPALADWWQTDAGNELEPMIGDLIDRFAEVGEYLGDEMVVSGTLPLDDDFEGPMLMAEVRDAAALRDFIERQINDASSHVGHGFDGGLVWVDDPLHPTQGDEDHLFVWLDEGLMVASLDAEAIRTVASVVLEGTANPFTETDFYDDIAALYETGTEIIVAIALDEVVEMVSLDEQLDGDEVLAYSRLGVDQVRHLLVEQKRVDSKTHYAVSLSFSGKRQGVASWLATPAPMGSLDFVSPEAKLVASVVFEDPIEMFDDLYTASGEDEGFTQFLQLFREEHGINLRDDLFGALGGELTLALDGPLLPQPAWKAILEVYDPARLQFAIERGVAEANQQMAEEGGGEITLSSREVSGRTFYQLSAVEQDIHYTFVEGYWVVAPTHALLDRAVRFYGSGYSIVDAASFTRLLPNDGRNNFSAILYQDLSSLLQSVAERLADGQVSEEQQQSLDALKASRQPTLAFAYGDEDRITLAAASEGDVLSTVVMRLLGFKDPGSWEQLLQDGLADVDF